VSARITLLKIDRAKFLHTYPESRPLRDHSMFAQFNSLPSSALERGHCYIQDPSTTVACELLDPKPGERILDATAAPGGKTGYVAQFMENLGIIVACDRDPQRIDTLKQNMARLGVGIAQILQHDWTGQRVPPEITSVAPFDRILIDAPCSNTGVMRRRVDVRWRLQATDFVRVQQRQIEIVRALVRLLKPNGLLVYSTCSLEPEENEEVVRRILESSPHLRLAEEERSLPFQDRFDGAFAAKMIRSVA
jgi:16S rRNA (cytosine967-C5)-methyltransferase